MKKTTLLIFISLLTGAFAFAQVTWDNFEDQRKGTYGFMHGEFTPYAGTSNPDPTGNSSDVVAEYQRNGAELFDVIIIEGISLTEDLGDYLTNTKQMTIDVYSTMPGIKVQITLEDSSKSDGNPFPTGRHSEYDATTTKTNEWETLTFSFFSRPDMNVADTDVGRIVLLFNPNTNTSDIYHFDNLVGPGFAADPCAGTTPDAAILNDFECNQNSNIIFTHGRQKMRRVPNPDMSGGNTSDFVGSYVRNAGEENDVILGRFPAALSLGDTNEFTLMVWDGGSPTDVRLALQDASGMMAVDVAGVTVSTSASSQWQKLTFGYGDLTGANVDAFVILFDPGNFTSDQYFFDNFGYEVGGLMVGIEDYLSDGALNVYPNPSTGMTSFAYELTNAGNVSISMYDLTGRKVGTLNKGYQPAGSHEVTWDASGLENGLYIYHFEVNGQTSSGKIMISQ